MIEQQFIEYVVKQLVDNPDEVAVERITDDRGVLLKLTVAADDLGRVIGKHGATAQSLRNLLRALGTKNNEHYNLKIIDVDKPEETEQPSQPRETTNETPAESASETAAETETVDKPDTETVENTDDRAKKLREGLADLDDFDI